MGFIGTAGTSDSGGGTLNVDVAGGFELVPGEVHICRHQDTSANDGWSLQDHVGSDDGAGNIVGAGIFTSGQLTGTINYVTGAITVQETGTDVFTTGRGHWSAEYLQRHATIADDWDVYYASGSYNCCLVNKYLHSSLSDPVLNHGTHCLGMQPGSGNSSGGIVALLKDPLHLTQQAVMSQMIWRSNDLAAIRACMIQRAEAGGFPADHLYFAAMSSASGQARLYVSNDGGNTLNQPVGQTEIVRKMDAAADVYVQTVGLPWQNVWNVVRMISTVELGSVHLQLFHASGATEADKADPAWESWGHAWHHPGTGTPEVSDGSMGALVTSTWTNTTPAGTVTPGRAGFAMMRPTTGTAQFCFVDSFKAWVME